MDINWLTPVYLGQRKSDNTRILLQAPVWDSNWYWNFGRLYYRKEHFHLRDYKKGRNIDMHDALLEDYNLNQRLLVNLWPFCKLATSVYTLQSAVGLLQRGNSGYEQINSTVLPAIFNAIYDLF
jgi:hypothetical protein